MPENPAGFALAPESGVVWRESRFNALTGEPWLRIEGLALDRFRGRWVEITYSLSFWDEPVRPVFRFQLADDDHIDRIAAGPIAGRACWIGRVPLETRHVFVSPTNRIGPFDFRIDGIRPRSWLALAAMGLRWHTRPARSAILTRLIGWGPESDVNLSWAIGSMPMQAHDRWLRSHGRSINASGLERPRFDWAHGVPIHVVVRGGGSAAAVGRTLDSLQRQSYPCWTAFVSGVRPSADPRIRLVPDTGAVPIDRSDADVFTCLLEAGDELTPTAMAIVAEQAQRSPEVRLIYGDAYLRRVGAPLAPCLRPGWASRLNAAAPFVGPPLFVRGIAGWRSEDIDAYARTGKVPDAVVAALRPGQILSIRRILGIVEHGARRPSAPTPSPPPSSATAAVIIPTKDYPALERIIESIRTKSSMDRCELIVVDNASTNAETLAYLDRLGREAQASILRYPDGFNFSSMCNEAAKRTRADVLVFLNDDMEVLSEDWLDRLIAWAVLPNVGAVGARLVYPDGRLQHVGVLVGMGESAGHFGAPAPGDDPGWADRNLVPHEVSAVTGACLAVARDKFQAVGCFDEADLPIELSDIDLCLKLNARGWQTIIDPSIQLMHEESASRGGATLRRLTVHDRERKVFVERWRHVLRDDPFFHPGLSLYRGQAALA